MSNRIFAPLAALLICLAVPRVVSGQTNPIQFYANLTIDDQPAVINSKAIGHAEFTLDRETLRFAWRITFKDLTAPPTGIHIHYQKPGVRGGIVFDLAPNGVRNPLEGSLIMTDGDLLYLQERHLYVDIHTSKHLDGELRGNIERRRQSSGPTQ